LICLVVSATASPLATQARAAQIVHLIRILYKVESLDLATNELAVLPLLSSMVLMQS